jgi:nucleoside 2-deoxyribosyltransferase
MSVRIYLAGPEVFLANAHEVGERKRAICVRYGLVGVFPANEEAACDPLLSLPERGLAISRAMEHLMQGCDAMIVNLTPFRGPSADVGSAYEMGFMRALGRPIFRYHVATTTTCIFPVGTLPVTIAISGVSDGDRRWPNFMSCMHCAASERNWLGP